MPNGYEPSISVAPMPSRDPAVRTLTPAAPGVPFAIGIVQLGGQALRVGRQPGSGRGVPLLLFNGIGGNIELLVPIARWMPEREVITFDVPGVGHSALPSRPYRLRGIARLAAALLDRWGHAEADVLGVSWGGAAAQQFAYTFGTRCRRLILCATAPGMVMMPARPSVLLKMATPRRFMSRDYAHADAGAIYGGDFRRNPGLADGLFKHVRWQSTLGYYLQITAAWGWTSIHWLHRLRQPTLIMAGQDDPLVPVANAKLMHKLIPDSEIALFDCGHLFLLTRAEASARVINEFLDRPSRGAARTPHTESSMATSGSFADLAERVGQEIGVSSWITLDQQRISEFAHCTGDNQWTHVDVERAAKESPFGGTIAHGFLTLALLAPTAFELLISKLTLKQAVNYGLERVRFVAPVRAGKRVRNRMKLVAVEDKGNGRFLVTTENTIEIEGEEKPALVAHSQAMLIA